jgi:hypothetical protein
MKLHIVALLLLAPMVTSAAAPAPKPAETFTVDVSTKIPGATLRPGDYSISLVNHLSDRDILRVDSPNGTVHTTFIGIPNSHIPRPSGPQLVNWNNRAEGHAYVRGWYFPGSSAVTEFVYPKADAVAIAKVNQAKVLAIDPASEGRVDDPELSSDDMRLITLWMLSATAVGPGKGTPAIEAERYQALATVPPRPGTETTAAVPPPRKPVIKQLPHTASDLPWMWMVGLGALSFAGGLRFYRLRTDTTQIQQS